MFCILYGAEGRTDYKLSTPRDSMAEALADYRPDARITYTDGVLGGAAVVELRDGSPVRTVIQITIDLPGDDICALRSEAAAAGDLAMVAICNRALTGDADALAECDRAISDAAAMVDE